jgi:hypothetical protein
MLTAQFWAKRMLSRLSKNLAKLGDEGRFGLDASGRVVSGNSDTSASSSSSSSSSSSTSSSSSFPSSACHPSAAAPSDSTETVLLPAAAVGAGAAAAAAGAGAAGAGAASAVAHRQRNAHFHIPFPRPMTMPREMQVSHQGGHLFREGKRVAGDLKAGVKSEYPKVKRQLMVWADKQPSTLSGASGTGDNIPVVDPDDLARLFPVSLSAFLCLFLLFSAALSLE